MRRFPLLCLGCLWACRAPLPEREPPSAAPPFTLSVEPPEQAGRIQPVSRFFLTPPDEEALVIRGELSEYHLRKLRERELPKTLSARIVSAQSWLDADSLVLSPLSVLAPAEVYSVASPELGLIARLEVVADAAPPLGRVWPPLDAGGSAEFWLFCGELAPSVAGAEEALLEPGHQPVWAAPEPGSGCVSLRASAGVTQAEPLVPPLAVLGRSLEPAALSAAAAHVQPAPLDCAGPELPFGPGCIAVADDRAVVRAPEAATLWSVSGEPGAWLEPLDPGGKLVLRGLAPNSTELVSYWVRDAFAELSRGQLLLTTGPALPHVVLSEVFANPLGAEPAQEWVELYNDGTIPVELSTLSLEDGGGKVELPAFVLAPGSFALIVRDDYDPASSSDPAPAQGTKLLRVPALGKNGLSNSGEALALRAGGQLISKFPALPKPKAGVSVARRKTWTLDDDASGFGHHAAPGASPGAPNALAD
ncbi:MAG: lamin tail domain-containing protein [Polyangiaceae bacterium]|nr:lamin tail domain-containing protein [Polyangiaceae bacterium]MCL4755401.1 lamin tail domain-containing protein [Myxococcales bacterium]